MAKKKTSVKVVVGVAVSGYGDVSIQHFVDPTKDEVKSLEDADDGGYDNLTIGHVVEVSVFEAVIDLPVPKPATKIEAKKTKTTRSEG